MSTINCVDKSCIYQKDGKCEFNSVISGKISTNGQCVHYRAAEQEKRQMQPNKLF